MPIPALALAYGLSAGVGLYTAHRYSRAVNRVSDYQTRFYGGAYAENRRFFERYRRLHHIQHRAIRYPYRTGYTYNLSQLQNAGLRKMSAQNSVWNSGARVGGIFGFYAPTRGYRGNPNYVDVMFG